MLIHPDKRNKGRVVPVHFVCTIKYYDITKCCIIKLTLSITLEQYLEVPFLISLVVKEEIRIPTFALSGN